MELLIWASYRTEFWAFGSHRYIYICRRNFLKLWLFLIRAATIVTVCMWQKKEKLIQTPLRCKSVFVPLCSLVSISVMSTEKYSCLWDSSFCDFFFCLEKWSHFKMLSVKNSEGQNCISQTAGDDMKVFHSEVCRLSGAVTGGLVISERKLHPLCYWWTHHLSPQQPWRQTESRTSRGPRPMAVPRLGPAPAPLQWIPCLYMKGRRSR